MAAAPWLAVPVEAESAAGRTFVGTLEMFMTNRAMTASAAEVTQVSSQSIRRWKRRFRRRRAAMLASRTSVSQPGVGVPMPSG